MRILITGGTGQLGRDLQRALSPHEVVALARADLDVTDGGSVDGAFAAHRPDAVVHCAALTDTARCEREPGVAQLINAQGAAHVARAAWDARATLIAISTNEVFDGTKGAPYAEDDAPSAVNAYGASKLDGERHVLAAHAEARIVRTSWLYGAGGTNFVDKVLQAARGGRALRFVTDEIATPTSTVDVAHAIGALIERDAPPGVYHLANEGEASRYAWAREILRLGGLDATIEAITTEELRAGGYDGALKPAYSVLANTRARAVGITLRPWREALAAYFARAKVAADG